MKVIVQKFGGASLSDPLKVMAAAKRISKLKTAGINPVVVVSAMGDRTNELIRNARLVNAKPNLRDMDALLSTGELESAAMMSLALAGVGCPAQCLSGFQAGISTDSFHSNASISDIDPARLRELISKNIVPVVTGFQGTNPTGDTTTLGRGGSDTTAIALAAVLGAVRCEILKEVPSVFSADPRLIPDSFPLDHLSYDELMDMTFWGAKVLQYRSVEIAKHFRTEIYIGPA